MQSAQLGHRESLSVSRKLAAEKEKTPADENIWKSILAEASKKAGHQEGGNVLVLSAGTDIAHLTINSVQGVMELAEEERLGNANIASNVCFVVDFAHVDLKDRSSHDSGGLVKEEKRAQTTSFWVINDGSRKDILLQQLKRRTMRYSTTAAVICMNLEEPWSVLEQCSVLTALLDEILQGLTFADDKDDAVRLYEDRMLTKVREEYKPPGAEETKVERNLGIPVIFCLCHAEAVPMIIENKRCVGWMDAISLYLRKYCLGFLAPLFCIQQQKKKVANILFDYLGHVLYGYNFTTPANTKVLEELFIPGGYDSLQRIMENAKDTVAEGLSKDFSQIVSLSKMPGQSVSLTGLLTGKDAGKAGGGDKDISGPAKALVNYLEGSGNEDQPLVVTKTTNAFLAEAMKELGTAKGGDGGGSMQPKRKASISAAPDSNPDAFFANLIGGGGPNGGAPSVEGAKEVQSSESVKEKLERLKAAKKASAAAK